MQKIIDLEGKEFKLVANALLPRLYRFHFGTDILMDLQKFQNDYKKDPQTVDFTPMENLAWLMLKEGGEDVGETPEEWLRTLDDLTSVYALAGAALALWEQSQKAVAKPKKK